MTFPVRQESAHGQPEPETSIERCCTICGASFIGLAPGKTGEAGTWHPWPWPWRWYCSLECDPTSMTGLERSGRTRRRKMGH